MSSKYIEKAWNYKCISMDEKLLLVAFAELADRNGAFTTTFDELKNMMCTSSSIIDNLIGKLLLQNVITGINKRTPAYCTNGRVQGKLNIDTYVESTSNDTIDKAASSNFYQKINRIPNFHRSQVNSLTSAQRAHSISIAGKAVNINEISSQVVEDWAEIIMFKSGFGGQTNIWAEFVFMLKNTSPKALVSLDELSSRLHAYLNSEKTFNVASKNSNYQNKNIKQSSIEALEDKINNFFEYEHQNNFNG